LQGQGLFPRQPAVGINVIEVATLPPTRPTPRAFLLFLRLLMLTREMAVKEHARIRALVGCCTKYPS